MLDKPRADIDVSTQVFAAPLPEATNSRKLLTDFSHLGQAGTPAGSIDPLLIKPAPPAPTPAATPAPHTPPAPAPNPGPSPAPAPLPAPSPAPSPTSFAGQYTVSGGGVNVQFTVDATGKVTSCSAGVLIVCSGSVNADGSFSTSGNDGATPVDTSATLTGRIGGDGSVTGTFQGSSTSDGVFAGALSGSRAGGSPAIEPGGLPRATHGQPESGA